MPREMVVTRWKSTPFTRFVMGRMRALGMMKTADTSFNMSALARAVGVAPQVAREWFVGGAEPNPQTVPGIAKGLLCSIPEVHAALGWEPPLHDSDMLPEAAALIARIRNAELDESGVRTLEAVLDALSRLESGQEPSAEGTDG